MPRWLLTVAALALLAAPLAWGASGGPIAPVEGSGDPGDGTVTATLSAPAPGARTALSLGLHAELQCGRLVARTLAVRLPSQMRVPRAIPAGAVTVGGRPAADVAVAGATVVVTIPLVKGAICDVLGPGVYRVVFGRRAGLRNPPAQGSYRFTVTAAPRAASWRGTFAVRS